MSECIAQDVFLISPTYIPGQEEGNIRFMEHHRVGKYIPDPDEVIRFLHSMDFSKLIPGFHSLKKPDSVAKIIETMEGIEI